MLSRVVLHKQLNHRANRVVIGQSIINTRHSAECLCHPYDGLGGGEPPMTV